jgi:CBS domain-containing protein
MRTTVAHLLAAKGRDVWSVSPDTTVYEALETMSQKGVGALVVIGEDGALAGIMSERDYARKVVLLDRVSKTTEVREIMTGEVHTVTAQSSVADCMGLMTDKRIRHLPVIDKDRVIGVVSIGDIVKAVIQDQKFLIEQLEQYITS